MRSEQMLKAASRAGFLEVCRDTFDCGLRHCVGFELTAKGGKVHRFAASYWVMRPGKAGEDEVWQMAGRRWKRKLKRALRNAA